MATPKKLPSGNYRIQVYHYTDVYGRKHYKSFTAPSKKQAALLAAEWEVKKKEESDIFENMTIYKAIKKYIDIKRSVLSPSTLRDYLCMLDCHFATQFGQIKLSDLTNSNIQIWISGLTDKLSPKRIRNIYGLLSAALEMFYPDFRIKVTLPQREKPDLYCPSDEDIRILLQHIKDGKDFDLETAVLLAAFGTLRRSEICALTSDDIIGNTITIRHAMVMDTDGEWIVKAPKTLGSIRVIHMPDFIIKRLSGINGAIIQATPSQISDRFRKAVKSAGLHHFRFHDLRHYSASIMHAIGVPDQYIMQRGGWSSDNIMKSVYRNVIDLENVKQSKKINQHFEKISHEISHKG